MYGFLITSADPEDDGGLRAEDADRFEEFGAATIDLKYRKVPPLQKEIAAQESVAVR